MPQNDSIGPLSIHQIEALKHVIVELSLLVGVLCNMFNDTSGLMIVWGELIEKGTY